MGTIEARFWDGKGCGVTGSEIIRRVDDGANYYVRLFGEAPHMESIDNGVYRVIRPRKGEQGVQFVCDIRPDRLDKKRVREIKRLRMPVWWPLLLPDPLKKAIKRKLGSELYMAVFPGKLVSCGKAQPAMQVESAADFARWAAAVQRFFGDACAYIHPQHHYPLCQSGAMRCYFIERDGQVIATASILREGPNASLESVAVDPAFRRQGLASGVCLAAIEDAFARGAEIVTLRAQNPGTRELYTSLGFRIYNYALGEPS